MNATQKKRLDRLAGPEAARLARKAMLAVARARTRLTLREVLALPVPGIARRRPVGIETR